MTFLSGLTQALPPANLIGQCCSIYSISHQSKVPLASASKTNINNAAERYLLSIFEIFLASDFGHQNVYLSDSHAAVELVFSVKARAVD